LRRRSSLRLLVGDSFAFSDLDSAQVIHIDLWKNKGESIFKTFRKEEEEVKPKPKPKPKK
jgi:hypothetical protein